MALPQVTVTGRLTADPELRFIPSGKAVASFTVAASERRLNKDTQEWSDGDKCFIRCTAWEQQAENIAESFLRGQEVLVTGSLFQRDYETREGEKRTSLELKNVTIAAVVGKSTTVKVNKLERGSSGGGYGNSTNQGPEDPWGTPSGAGGYADEEPPF